MTTNVLTFSLAVAIVLVAAVGAGIYFLAPPALAPAMDGFIEGTTSYPSEYLPEQIVCAEPVAGGDALCTDVPEGYADQLTPTWRLQVPVGSYYVWARLKDPADVGSDFGNYRAYYTEYVRCGLGASCTNHDYIAVDVQSDETVSDIKPYDWYIR